MTNPGPAHWTNFRDIPHEVLRDFVRTRAEATSIRQVAVEMGVGRTTLHSFINAETTPHPRIRRLIALSLLDWHENAPDMDVVRPYAVALEVLIRGVPEPRREATITTVLDGLESGYTGDGTSPPRWVEVLRIVARRRMVPR